ncbi:hypothetical protein EWM64_g8120 [Hericium alpestre]|uniref:Uncharacterized protein n=1 Tax=Hericium alpestre TaxID=135208 RepID=A0A4Y9ZPY4_9AGAM|nr:hypothetical protein EWM64_g8120 [Hericium alpestre]
MQPIVPAEIFTEPTQILANLVLGDNEIRMNAGNAVNERLAQTLEVYLQGLIHLTMRLFSLGFLRRLLFRTSPNQTGNAARVTRSDHASSQMLTTLEPLLLRF